MFHKLFGIKTKHMPFAFTFSAIANDTELIAVDTCIQLWMHCDASVILWHRPVLWIASYVSYKNGQKNSGFHGGKTLYTALVRPIFEYGSVNWYAHCRCSCVCVYVY